MKLPDLEQLLELLYVLPVGVVQFDAQGRVSLINPRVVSLLLPVVGPSGIADAFTLLRPLVPDLASAINRSPDNGVLLAGHRRLLDSGRQAQVVDVAVHRIGDRYIALLTDITEQAEARQRLAREEQRFRAILEAIQGYAIYSVDPAGVVDSWNPSAARVFGLPEATGRSLQELVPAPTGVKPMLEEARQTGWQTVAGWVEGSSGERRLFETLISPLDASRPAGADSGFVAVSRDRTDDHSQREQLEIAAHTDPLTGLSNRRAFYLAHHAMMVGQPGPHSILLLDLDHFKLVNDNHGHETGDRVLVEVAAVLRRQARGGDFPGRLGGEEFALLLPSVSLEQAIAVAERLRAAIEARVVLLADGSRLPVTASIGVAPVTGPLEAALHAADTALYAAKARGRNCVCLADSSAEAAPDQP